MTQRLRGAGGTSRLRGMDKLLRRRMRVDSQIRRYGVRNLIDETNMRATVGEVRAAVQLIFSAAATIGFAHCGVDDKSVGPTIWPRSTCNTSTG
jgi:hypothetical protein